MAVPGLLIAAGSKGKTPPDLSGCRWLSMVSVSCDSGLWLSSTWGSCPNRGRLQPGWLPFKQPKRRPSNTHM